MKFTCVLFDLDGTLINTNDLVIKSHQYTIREHLGEEWEESQFIPYFGEPLITTLERFAPGQGEKLIKTYREFNIANHDQLTKEFPGIYDTLRQLKEKGIELGVVTSKLKETAWRGMRLFNLAQFFSVVVAYEDTTRHKPEADPILKALGLLGRDQQGVLYVGDSTYDIRSAKQARVHSAAVMWSAYDRDILQAEQPDYLLDGVEDLLSLV